MEASKLFTNSAMDSMTVARMGYRAMMRGKRIVITGVQNKILATSVRFMPRGVVLLP